MRRGEESRAITGLSKDRCEHRRCRTLALAPRDMDDPQPVLGIAQQPQQGSHAVELEIVRLRRMLLVIDAAVPEVEGLLVSHKEKVKSRMANGKEQRPEPVPSQRPCQ